jgi:hypothetical protein
MLNSIDDLQMGKWWALRDLSTGPADSVLHSFHWGIDYIITHSVTCWGAARYL